MVITLKGFGFKPPFPFSATDFIQALIKFFSTIVNANIVSARFPFSTHYIDIVSAF